MLHQQATHVADDLASRGRRRSSPTREGGSSGGDGGVNIFFGRERKFPEAVCGASRICALKGATVARKCQLPVHNVVSPNLRKSIRILVREELKTALQDVCHDPPVTVPLINPTLNHLRWRIRPILLPWKRSIWGVGKGRTNLHGF